MQEEFYHAMTNLRRANKSRAASPPSKQDTRITEIINGVLVSRATAANKEPEVIDLQEYVKSKAASLQGINKMKVIHDFIIRRRY
jgi:hypothetical protein